MEESNEVHNIVPGERNSWTFKVEFVCIRRTRSYNSSFSDFRTLLSDSEISDWRTPQRDCKGKNVTK